MKDYWRKLWVNRTLTHLPAKHGKGLECLSVISFHAEQEVLQLIASFKTIVRLKSNSYLPNTELLSNSFGQEVGMVCLAVASSCPGQKWYCGEVGKAHECTEAYAWGLNLMKLAEALGPKQSLNSALTYNVIRRLRSSHEGWCDGSVSF